MPELTDRQRRWRTAADEEAGRGNDTAAVLFSLLALPNAQERQHDCREHSRGFRLGGRRGFRCGICRTVIRWVD